MLSLEQQNLWRERYRLSNPGWKPATEVFAEHVKRLIRPESKLLDLGCGRGGLIEQLDHPLKELFGVDPDYQSLREHRVADFQRVHAFSDQLPFAAGTFDLVIAAWILEHLADPVATFAAVSRVLKAGGSMVFITPNARHPLGWANQLAGRLGRIQGRVVDSLYGRAEEDTFPTTYRANNPELLNSLAHDAGLSVETLDLVLDPTYLSFNRVLFKAMSAIDKRLPAGRRIHIVGVIRKPRPDTQ